MLVLIMMKKERSLSEMITWVMTALTWWLQPSHRWSLITTGGDFALYTLEDKDGDEDDLTVTNEDSYFDQVW